MSKNKYKLQSVLDVRQRAKQDAARIVALRRAQLEDAEEELARRENELERCRAQHRDAQTRMMNETVRGAEARFLVEHRSHIADLRAQEETLVAAVEEQRSAVARAERELEQSLNGLAEASKELRVIDAHQRHWKEGEQLAERRREQKAGDEIAATRHKRGKRES
jgi:flagellar export protein FliJ